MQSDETPEKAKSDHNLSSKRNSAEPALQELQESAPPDDHTIPSIGYGNNFTDSEQPANASLFNTSEIALVGEIIDNQYKIISILGRGGMSVVYKAKHLVLNKVFAIKTMHSHLINETALMRFRQEAQAASQIDHPNVIKVYNISATNSDNSRPYIVMDFIEGRSLSELVRESGRLPVRMTLKICMQVCNALAHAHSMGIVHRDLKPSNIMLIKKDPDSDYQVKLVDFGIAKLLPLEGEHAHRLTQTGEVFGSPMYMSPEQCMGQNVDSRSDIYSLGCVLYEALCGKPPLYGNNVFETFQKHTSEIPAPLQIPGEDKALVDHLDAVVFRALEKQPEKRYQKMSDFEIALGQVEAEIDSGLRFKGLSRGLAKQQRSLRRFFKSFPQVAGVLCLLAAGLLAGSYFVWQRYSWFLKEEHVFSPPTTHWFYFLRARHKVNLSSEEKQAKLDQGSTAAQFARLAEGDSRHYLDVWKTRALLCAKYDCPKEEIEARRNVLDLERELNGATNPSYGLAEEQLAECLVNEGDYREAWRYLLDALSIRQRLEMEAPRENLLLGYTLARLGRPNEAVAQLDQALKLLEGEDARLTALAYALRADQQLVFARQFPREKQLHIHLADLDYAQAEEIIAASRKMKALQSEITLMRAYVNLVEGKYREARKMYGQEMPYAEKTYALQAAQLQHILDGYAYACWRSGDYLLAGQLRARSTALGVQEK